MCIIAQLNCPNAAGTLLCLGHVWTSRTVNGKCEGCVRGKGGGGGGYAENE